jgi:hypothetical protein
LWEIFARDFPFAEYAHLNWNDFQFKNFIIYGQPTYEEENEETKKNGGRVNVKFVALRPTIPSHCPSEIRKQICQCLFIVSIGTLIQECWTGIPEKRPEMYQVLMKLESFLKTSPNPVVPTNYNIPKLGMYKPEMNISPEKKSQILSLALHNYMVLAGTVDGSIYAWKRDVRPLQLENPKKCRTVLYVPQ